MKILDYDGFKQVITKIKALIDKKADKTKVVTSVNGKKGDMMVDFFTGDDTRYITNIPKDYLRDGARFKSNTSSQFEFKRCTTVGIDHLISQDYCIVNTQVPWHDKTGGLPMQIAYGKGVMAIRTAKDENTWDSWSAISTSSDLSKYAKSTDLPTRLSQLSGDATHRLVTDSEKSTWDNKLSDIKNQDGSTMIAKGSPTSGVSKWYPITNSRQLQYWLTDFDMRTRENKTKLDAVKEQVILTETEYNALSSTQKNDASKIYFIKA